MSLQSDHTLLAGHVNHRHAGAGIIRQGGNHPCHDDGIGVEYVLDVDHSLNGSCGGLGATLGRRIAPQTRQPCHAVLQYRLDAAEIQGRCLQAILQIGQDVAISSRRVMREFRQFFGASLDEDALLTDILDH